LLFPARSTEYLPQCYPRSCAPNRGRRFLSLANAENGGESTARSNPTRSGPLRQDCALLPLEPRPSLAPGLIRAYHSAPWLGRSLRPTSLAKRRSLQNAIRTRPRSTDRRRLAYRRLPHETARPSNARSEQHAARIVERTRDHLR